PRLHDPMPHVLDFTDTAAILENLDLLVTIDTSVAHLAGALGRPVWMLLRFDACWRWLLDRNDSPWYPSMRIFRQEHPNQWESAVRRVADELRRAVSSCSPGLA